MQNDINKKPAGFSYHYSAEQIQEFQKLTYTQRLKWVEEMNNFLQKFMPPESKVKWDEIRRGEK